MAAAAIQAASKPSKKKAVKAGLERTGSPAPSTGSGPTDKAAETADDHESPFIKELQKNIRNANKKLTAASKTDAILTQHPGKSLDDLVAERIINADQRAQILKKPALQAQIVQFEEQLAQCQKIHEQYLTKAAADKAEWEKSLDKAKQDAANEAKAEAKAEAAAEAAASLKESLLTLSQFLRLAAYRREEAKDPESDESQAIEGVLLAIYSGDQNAVSAMLKLIEGSSDKIISVPGEQLETTYDAIATLAKTYQGPLLGEEAEATEVLDEAGEAPTNAPEIEAENNAPVSELAPVEPTTNGHARDTESEDATAITETSFDASLAKDETLISQEWVDVAHPKLVEGETVVEAIEVLDAAEAKKKFWADDQPETIKPAPTSDANDGFHQVQRNKPRQDREGGERGRGRGRGEWRGRGGFRGDGRGRGRGNRGGAGGPPRAPRRVEEL